MVTTFRALQTITLTFVHSIPKKINKLFLQGLKLVLCFSLMAPPPQHGPKRQHSRNPKNATGTSSPASSASAILAEARKLKQQAERKAEGADRDPVLKRSAQLFEKALAVSLSLSHQEEALFDLGEILLLSSGSVQAGVSTLTGSIFNPTVQKPKALEIQLQACITAANLCKQSHEIFERICSMEGGGVLKEEAAVNSGNALCEWAELALEIPTEHGGGMETATALYNHASERYNAALTSSPEDVELLTNVGDCSIQMAELAGSSMQLDGSDVYCAWNQAKQMYEIGLGAYSSACGNADTRIGDDLAGLLQNWGVGLFSVAQRSPDPEEAMKFVETAREKLKSAMKFRHTDSSLFLALGEGLLGVAEQFTGKPYLQQQGHIIKGTGQLTKHLLEVPSVLVNSNVVELLKEAVNEGFGAVLNIDSKNVHALLGLGDAHLAAGKVLLSYGSDPNSGKHLDESVNSYNLAFKLLKEDSEGKYNLKFDEQCDALYNLACAAALACREGDAHAALVQLLHVDALPAKDLVEDPDLVSLRTKDWFISMV